MNKIKYSRIFILGVFIYIFFKGTVFALGLKTSVITLKNEDCSMKITTKAMIVRDEYLIKSDVSGNLSICVNENEKVQNSQKIATIYNKYIDEDINEEIQTLKQEIKKIENNTNALQMGILSSKKEQLEILENKVKNNTMSCYSSISGIVSIKYDNKENIYNSSNLSDITKEDIEKATNNYTFTKKDDTKVKEGDVIARVINDNHVYIVFVTEDNKLFNEGDNVKIKNGNDIINGEVYVKYNKNSYFITVIKITQQNVGIYDTRKAEFDIIYKQIEALRIPKESIVEEDDKSGVYVINEENNKPEFVEVKGISCEDDEYIYVDFRSNEKKGIDTVKLHDRIILKPNFINKRIEKTN